MTRPPARRTAVSQAPRIYTATRFQLALPEPADRVDVRVLDAAYENIGDNAAHLTLGNDLAGEQVLLEGALTQVRIDTPAALPAAGRFKFYPKLNGEFYKLDEFGVETPFGAGGGCEHEEFLPTAGATTVTLVQTVSHITMVARDGLVQSEADAHYTLTGPTTLTFNDPFNGAERVIVDYAHTPGTLLLQAEVASLRQDVSALLAEVATLRSQLAKETR